MNEYWLIFAVCAALLVLITLWFGKKKGWFTDEGVKMLSSLLQKIEKLSTELKDENSAVGYDVANLIITFVNRGVLAAENAWYHGDITAEERRGYCLELVEELFSAFGVELSAEQWSTADILITAACEEMGHNKSENVE